MSDKALKTALDKWFATAGGEGENMVPWVHDVLGQKLVDEVWPPLAGMEDSPTRMHLFGQCLGMLNGKVVFGYYIDKPFGGNDWRIRKAVAGAEPPDLRECVFCYGSAEWMPEERGSRAKAYYAQCTQCGATGPAHGDPREAASMWNKPQERLDGA